MPFMKLLGWYKKGHFTDDVKVRGGGGGCGNWRGGVGC